MKKPKLLVCRFCGDECDAKNRDTLSHWSHHHPSWCPHRQDRMPALNGVHVGDVWRNRHTGKESVVTEIRLGGAGVYTDREPVFILDGHDHIGGNPMWSLSEHWDPVTRPGEYPVPWTNRGKSRGGRWAHKKWRGVGMRGRSRKRQVYAFWHAYHQLRDQYSIDWDYTNRLWQIDPQAQIAEEQNARALAGAQELLDSGDELLARVGAQMAEIFAEAA